MSAEPVSTMSSKTFGGVPTQISAEQTEARAESERVSTLFHSCRVKKLFDPPVRAYQQNIRACAAM